MIKLKISLTKRVQKKILKKNNYYWTTLNYLLQLTTQLFAKNSFRSQFHQCFMHVLFVQNFGAKNFKHKIQLCNFWHQNFVWKMRVKNVDETDGRCRSPAASLLPPSKNSFATRYGVYVKRRSHLVWSLMKCLEHKHQTLRFKKSNLFLVINWVAVWLLVKIEYHETTSFMLLFLLWFPLILKHRWRHFEVQNKYWSQC